MEENILKYFTGNQEYEFPTIRPKNIKNEIISTEALGYRYTLTTKDNNYFIRYGGFFFDGRYNTIDVYDMTSIEKETPLYSFNNLKIEGHTFTVIELKQDENGRFYGLGEYGEYVSGQVVTHYYLILFNNFIQDGNCEIRKYYTTETMQIPDNVMLNDIVKKEGSAEYYIRDLNGHIFCFKIDVLNGNTLNTYNYTEGGNITSGTYAVNFEIIDNDLILMENWLNDSNSEYEAKKLIIDTTKEIQETYTTEVVISGGTENGEKIINVTIDNFNYYVAFLFPNLTGEYYFKFFKINLDGNYEEITDRTNNYSDNINASFTNDYCFLYGNSTLSAYIRNTSTGLFRRFLNVSFSGSFSQPQIIKKFNLIYFIGINSQNSISYSKNIYSAGYTTQNPYISSNFIVSQYLNLYSDSNDNTSVIFSRDVSNRFLAGNQLTNTFNVPNYMLNDTEIQQEEVIGQTNLTIENNNKILTKNRFESLYLNYIYNIYVTDNTNGNNMSNVSGANRIAKTLWAREYEEENESCCLKARITYDDDTQEIINLDMSNVSGTSHTFEYQVSGNINKIEYLSQDEDTIYATYRCNLTGTNTISQTIEVKEA